MTSEDPDGPWALGDSWTITRPDRPLVDDQSAAVLNGAVAELVVLRSPMSIGDALADLHAMASLLGQLHASMPMSVADAWDQDHTWVEISRQLQITPATARRQYRAYLSATSPPLDEWSGTTDTAHRPR